MGPSIFAPYPLSLDTPRMNHLNFRIFSPSLPPPVRERALVRRAVP